MDAACYKYCSKDCSCNWGVKKPHSYRPGAVPLGESRRYQTNTKLRTAHFLFTTQRVVVISYRRFGTTYRSHLQGTFWILEL
jgi:hypothetical protein